MDTVNISGIEIDACSACGGIWFDNFELKKLDEHHEGSGELLEKLLSFSRIADHNEKRICPKCDITLHSHEYSVNTNIFVDECYACGGIWLDAGELAAIRENFRSEKDREEIVENMLGQNTEFKKRAQEREILNRSYEARKSFFSSLAKW